MIRRRRMSASAASSTATDHHHLAKHHELLRCYWPLTHKRNRSRDKSSGSESLSSSTEPSSCLHRHHDVSPHRTGPPHQRRQEHEPHFWQQEDDGTIGMMIEFVQKQSLPCPPKHPLCDIVEKEETDSECCDPHDVMMISSSLSDEQQEEDTYIDHALGGLESLLSGLFSTA